MKNAILHQNVKFYYRDAQNKRRATTITIPGRTPEELAERVEKLIIRKTIRGWTLR